jgi:hypothetical protein
MSSALIFEAFSTLVFRNRLPTRAVPYRDREVMVRMSLNAPERIASREDPADLMRHLDEVGVRSAPQLLFDLRG